MSTQRSGRLPLRDARFVIVASGFAEGPSQALGEFVLRRGIRSLTVVSHPLVPEGPHHHEIRTYERGVLVDERTIAAPHRPPATYLLDLVVPLAYERSDVWFGFNGIAVARGLAERARGRAARVVSWHVDFVPDRFGRGAPITRAYDALDRYVCRHVDLRVELSPEALAGRDARHGLAGRPRAPHLVVPMGTWLARVPKVPDDAWSRRRIVFLGHLVPRQGVLGLVDALAVLHRAGVAFEADVIGGGPVESDLRRRVEEEGLGSVVRVHGFVAEFREVEQLLADSSVAVAPYQDDRSSFTRFADPGKLKAYLGAGLPIVMTPVPPNAAMLAERGAVSLVDDDPAALAQGVRELLEGPEPWGARHRSAGELAKDFDWDHLLPGVVERLGISVDDEPGR